MQTKEPQSTIDSSLFSTVDFRAFFETLRLRWWVIPLVLGLVVVFLQAQDSDLRTEPATYIVSRGYEIGNPQAALQALGLNLSIIEFPDPDTQLLILKSNEVREEISAELGVDVSVQTPVSFETPATFTCNQPIIAECEKAIDAYVLKATEIRQESIAKGVENLQRVLSRLKETSDDPLVPKQIAALDAFAKNLTVPFVLVDGFEQSVGPTMSDVRRPTVIMGIAAGLFISLLILLQLTFVDGRIRSSRQLVRVTGTASYLGLITAKADSVRDRRTAVSIRSELNNRKRSVVRFMPLRRVLQVTTSLERVVTLTGASSKVCQPISELPVSQIVAPSDQEADILVVQRNRDFRKDVIEAVVTLEKSGRQFVGILLID